jgi:uncharacterized membrane protein (Fun14 family)
MFNQENITQFIQNYGVDVGYGFIVGFIIGYSVKKLLQIFIIALGIYLISLIWLEHKGFIEIHWDVLGPAIKEGQNKFQAWVNQLFKAVPFTTAFAGGFAIGFKMA